MRRESSCEFGERAGNDTVRKGYESQKENLERARGQKTLKGLW